MHLKQFKWKTVPSARTNWPCIAFPQAEHVEARLAEVEEPTLGCLAALDWDEDTE